MINEEKGLSETIENITAELVLLGNILNDMTLIERYGCCLQREDFHDQGSGTIYEFLCDYIKNFGTEYSTEKVGIMYLKWKTTNKIIAKTYSTLKSFIKNLDSLKELGVTNAPVDNIHYQAVKKDSCLRKLKAAGINTTFIEKNRKLQKHDCRRYYAARS